MENILVNQLNKNKYILIFLIIVSVSCKSELKVPNRIGEIPPNAVWAGGADGGSWISCKLSDSLNFEFDCKIFEDNSGSLITEGTFLLRKHHFSKSSKETEYFIPKKLTSELKFNSYDGKSIFLDSSFVLIPNGWINHPFDSLSGKKQLFEKGREIKEVQY